MHFIHPLQNHLNKSRHTIIERYYLAVASMIKQKKGKKTKCKLAKGLFCLVSTRMAMAMPPSVEALRESPGLCEASLQETSKKQYFSNLA